MDTETPNPSFNQYILESIHPEDVILELGAGDGFFARECLRRQARVVAVDRLGPEKLVPDIDWQVMDVREYIDRLQADGQFNLVYSRNLVQFLDSTWVFETMIPKLKDALKPGGVLAFQTFSRDPEPPFDRKIPSLYELFDFLEAFDGWEIERKADYSDRGPDRTGKQRKFFMVEIVCKKPLDKSS